MKLLVTLTHMMGGRSVLPTPEEIRLSSFVPLINLTLARSVKAFQHQSRSMEFSLLTEDIGASYACVFSRGRPGVPSPPFQGGT